MPQETNGQRRDPNAQEKLQLANELNQFLDRRCEDLGFYKPCSTSEILVLAIYARTDPQERSSLFINGLK